MTFAVSPSRNSTSASSPPWARAFAAAAQPFQSAAAAERGEPLLGLARARPRCGARARRAAPRVRRAAPRSRDRGAGALADVALGLAEPPLQRLEELLALALEVLGDRRQARLEPPRARVADLGQALGERRLRVAGEHLDGAVELAAEPLRRLLARRLRRRLELLVGRVGVALGRPGDDPLELLDLAALDVLQRRARSVAWPRPPRARSGRRALSRAGAAAPRPRWSARRRSSECASSSARASLTASRAACISSVRRRATSWRCSSPSTSSRCISSPSRFSAAAISCSWRCGDLVHLAVEPLLRALEVARPGGDALGDAALHGGQPLGHRRLGVALALDEGGAARLGEPALLVQQRGDGFGAGARERRARAPGRGGPPPPRRRRRSRPWRARAARRRHGSGR